MVTGSRRIRRGPVWVWPSSAAGQNERKTIHSYNIGAKLFHVTLDVIDEEEIVVGQEDNNRFYFLLCASGNKGGFYEKSQDCIASNN
jgi:hypothetical protein